MRVVQEGEHEADRDRIHLEGPDARDHRIQPGLVERRCDLALGVDPLPDLEAPAARHQHRWGVLEEVVKVRAGRAPQLQHIAEPLGGDERDLGALRFQQRIGDDRGGVGDERDRSGVDAVVPHRRPYAVYHRGAEIARRGRHLGDARAPALLVQHGDIGERPADIDPDPPAHRAAPLPAPAPSSREFTPTAGRARKPAGRAAAPRLLAASPTCPRCRPASTTGTAPSM